MILGMLLLTASAEAAEYFVRQNGSNLASGLTPAEAWATVSHAASRLGAGDTVYIGAGTYSGQLYLVDRGGTAQSPVRFVGDSTGTHTGDAGEVRLTHSGLAHLQRSGYTEFVGLTLASTGNNVIYNDASVGVVLERCVVDGSGGALYAANGGSLIVRDCTISALQGHGVFLSGASLTMSGTSVTRVGTAYSSVHASNSTATIERSSLLDGNHVVYTDRSRVSLTNTVVANARACGVHSANSSVLALMHCTFNDIATDGLYAGSGTHTVRNTIFNDTRRYVYFRANNASITATNCLYANWGTALAYGYTPSNPVLADPGFSNASADDYTLLTGSGALDAGVDASAFTAVDRLGRARPDGGGWDIGAFEGIGGSGDEAPVVYRRVVRWREVSPVEGE